MNNQQHPPTPLLVAQAAAKAFGILTVGFLVLVHLYVLWKWDMPTTTTTTTTTTVTTKTTPWYETAAFVEPQQRLRDVVIPALQDELQKVTTRRQKVLELTRRVMELQQEQEQNAPVVGQDDEPLAFFAEQQANENDQYHAPQHLQKLIETGLVGYPTEAALRQAVRLAISDVQRNIQLSTAVQWPALATAMPATPTERLMITAANASSSGCAGGLTYADMAVHVERIRAKLHERLLIRKSSSDDDEDETTSDDQQRRPLPVSFDATLERLEAARAQHYETILHEAQATLGTKAGQMREELQDRLAAAATLAAADATTTTTATDTQNSGGDCIRAEQVVPWVHAGLQAMYRRDDFRNALLEEMESDGLNTRGIILDAAFLDGSSSGTSPFASTANNKQCRASMHSLRQVLDRTPFLTQHVSEWINVAVDAVSGYHDPLDQFVDDLFGNTDNTVGQQVVGRLLQAAGEVPLPEAIREKLQEHLVV